MPHEVPQIRVEDIAATAVLLDVREDDEWAAGRIEGAIHIPMNQVPQRLSDHAAAITPETDVVVLCKVGGRSAQVTAWLRQQGYRATNLEGGMLAWQAAGKPMQADGDNPPQVA